MKRKLYIITALLLTARAVPAAAPCPDNTPVRVPNLLVAGYCFTIRIPVRLPPGITGEYEWFRNGVAIPEARGGISSGANSIAYTVPADLAWGEAQEFYFMFRLSDYPCATCWDPSPRYVVSFLTICPPIPGVVSLTACSGGVSNGGAIRLATNSCGGGVSSAGTISLAACSGGVSNGGTISLYPWNGCGNTGGVISLVSCGGSAGGTISLSR